MSLTVAYHTGRTNPRFDWFFDSLATQRGFKRVTQIIIVDFYAQACDDWTHNDVEGRKFFTFCAARDRGLHDILVHIPPKPTIWQGPHRITKDNWWAMSNARNTSFALCRNDWIVLLDDRCVLLPNYLQAVKKAMARKHIVFGSYQKRHHLDVHNDVIRNSGEITGLDNREALAGGKVVKANGAWAYGCSLALPIEWALKVNGYPEAADSLGFEDILFGMILHHNHFPMRYDPSMRVIQDRTPSELDKPFRREDKGPIGTTEDKSHKSLEVIGGKLRSENEFDLRQLRKDALAGKPFPLPSHPNPLDWYDGHSIREL